MRLPGEILHSDELTLMMHGYAAVLSADGAFAGLCWGDAKPIAAAISADVTTRDDPAGVKAAVGQ